MDNPRFFDENIPLIYDEDFNYDDYDTPNTSRLDETYLQCLAPRKKKQHQLYG